MFNESVNRLNMNYIDIDHDVKEILEKVNLIYSKKKNDKFVLTTKHINTIIAVKYILKNKIKGDFIYKNRHKIDVKWYKCNCCVYKSKSNYDLKRHKANKHDIDVKWYECNCCYPYKTKDKSDLKKHKANVHKIKN